MKQLRLVVLDYGAGNLRSVVKALERLGARPEVSGEAEAVERAEALVFPGQGSCPQAMGALKGRGLVEPLRRFLGSGRPYLGVCLGLQLLFDSSEEGPSPCLGILPGRVVRFPNTLKVPHMGWNLVRFQGEHPVLAPLPREGRFYFVHSYYPVPEEPSLVAGATRYGVEFCAAVAQENNVATQFHPEKSGELGLALYDAFLRWARGVK